MQLPIESNMVLGFIEQANYVDKRQYPITNYAQQSFPSDDSLQPRDLLSTSDRECS
jgi:hypothetical protein